MRLPLSSPALFHAPKLLAGDAGDVVVDPLGGGLAQGVELFGGHFFPLGTPRTVRGGSTLPP